MESYDPQATTFSSEVEVGLMADEVFVFRTYFLFTFTAHKKQEARLLVFLSINTSCHLSAKKYLSMVSIRMINTDMYFALAGWYYINMFIAICYVYCLGMVV